MNSRVHWKDADWDAVALELYRSHPIVTMSSSTLTGISSYDVIAAMKKAIPENRWRASMNMTHVRPKLLERLELLKKKLQEIENEKAKEAQRLVDEENARRRASDDLNGPVMNLNVQALAHQLFKHLIPMIDSYIAEKTGKPVPMERIKEMPRERKPRIGVIGMLPIQANTLEKNFPQFDFSFVENGANSQEIKSKLANTAVTFGMVGKMRHNAEHVLKGMGEEVWERFRRVDGGPSAVKRSIEIWISQQNHNK